MYLAKYANDMNNLFSDITKSYLDICSNMKLLDNNSFDEDIFLENNINQVAASMNDLIINLQRLKFSIDGILDINIQSNNTLQQDNNINLKELNTQIPLQPVIPEIPNRDLNKLLNKTMKDMMPLFMMHLMANDKDSILNKPKPTNSNLSYTLHNSMENINNHSSSSNDPYDVD